MKTKTLRMFTLVPAALLLGSLPVFSANQTAARAQAAASEIKGDAAKSALTEIDGEIDQLEVLVDSAPTAEEKQAARLRLEALKERRNELRKTYVKARYEELKADIRAEASRLAAWTKRKFGQAGDELREATSDLRRESREASADARDDLNDAGRRMNAAFSSNAPESDLASYKLRPTDTNKEEARAAIEALGKNIDELEERIDAMPSSASRDAAERRVKILEDRKDALKGDKFNKAQFNALLDEVQREWDHLE